MNLQGRTEYSLAKAQLRELLTEPATALPHGGASLMEAEISEYRDLAATARQLLKDADRRGNYFDIALFADPAWHILLDLFVAEIDERPQYVSAVCAAARVPASTALRWIGSLEQKGLIYRNDDQRDGRRTYIRMAPEAFAQMASYLSRISTANRGLENRRLHP